MSLKFTTVPSKTLSASITSAASSFRLSDILGWDGTALVAGDFGSQAYCVFRNAARTQIEIMEFDPATIASSDITITRRGLEFDGTLLTEVTANKLSWTKGDTIVDLGSDPPQLWQWLKEYIDAAAIAGGVPSTTTVLGLVKMSTAPVSAGSPIAVGDNDGRVPTQSENDALAGYGGTPSSGNPYTVRAKAMTAGATINGASLPVPVYQNTTDNEYYACDGDDTAALKYQGFAISNGTDGAAITVQFTGIVNGFTGLDEGVPYYLSDTVGTIQNTPGTYEVLVGVAISSTELLIQKGKRYASGTTTFSSGSNQVITVGFRVSKVRVHAMYDEGGGGAHSHGSWTVMGGNRCVALVGDNAGGTDVTLQTALVWYTNEGGGGSAHSTGVVQDVTSTTFTLGVNYTGGTTNIIWEAEGDF